MKTYIIPTTECNACEGVMLMNSPSDSFGSGQQTNPVPGEGGGSSTPKNARVF